jgi:desampylase
MTSTLRLAAWAQDSIYRAAAATPGAEICGLLVEADSVVEAHISPNRHPQPARGFAICDAFHTRLQRQARARGATIVGCFHSHPSGETAPSQTDLLAAHEDGFIWLIAAPDGRMQAWRAKVTSGTKRFDAMTFEVVVTPHSAIAKAARRA